MTSKQKDDQPGAAVTSGDLFYNVLMSVIEPELMTTNEEAVAQAMATETEEQKEARMQRYDAAFARFDEIIQNVDADFRTRHEAHKKKARKRRKSEEHSSRTKENRAAEEMFTDDSSDA